MPTAAEILQGLDQAPPAQQPPAGPGGAGAILGGIEGPSEEEIRNNIRLAKLKRIAEATTKQMGATDIGIHNYTLGLVRPVGALGGALGGEFNELLGGGTPEATFGERYRAQEAAYDEQLQKARDESGWTGTAVGALGSLASPGSAGGGGGVGKMALTGGIQSGIQSAAESKGSAEDRLLQTGTGAATGAAVSGVLGGLFNRFLGKEGRAAERSLNRGTEPDVLRQQAKNLFGQLDDAGVAYDINQAGDLLTNIKGSLQGFNPKIQPKAAAVLDEIAGKTSQPLSLTQLMDLREQARSAAASIEPQDRRVAQTIMDEIDNFIEQQTPAISTSGMSADEIASTYQAARSKWRALNMTEDLLWNVSKAERRAASTNSGANTENTLRQNVRSMLDRGTQPRRFNPYNEAEIEAMEKVVRGGPVQNTLRAYGNRMGGSGPLGMSGAATTGAALTGGLSAMGVPFPLAAGAGTVAGGTLFGTGKAARMASSQMAENNVDDLIRLVSTEGMQSPRVQAIMQGPPTRARLALTQMLGRIATGGGRAAANQVTDQIGGGG